MVLKRPWVTSVWKSSSLLSREHSETTATVSLSQRQATVQNFSHSSLTLSLPAEFERRRLRQGPEREKRHTTRQKLRKVSRIWKVYHQACKRKCHIERYQTTRGWQGAGEEETGETVKAKGGEWSLVFCFGHKIPSFSLFFYPEIGNYV